VPCSIRSPEASTVSWRNRSPEDRPRSGTGILEASEQGRDCETRKAWQDRTLGVGQSSRTCSIRRGLVHGWTTIPMACSATSGMGVGAPATLWRKVSRRRARPRTNCRRRFVRDRTAGVLPQGTKAGSPLVRLPRRPRHVVGTSPLPNRLDLSPGSDVAFGARRADLDVAALDHSPPLPKAQDDTTSFSLVLVAGADPY
jgi:hypothetical protein